MAIRKTQAAVNEILDTGFDAMLNAGICEVRTGSQPAGADDPATGTLLWSETLPADAFAAAVAGVKAKAGTWQNAAVGAGVAGWFRLKKASDTNADTQTEARIDGSVTLGGGGGDMTLDNTNITVGQSVTVNTCNISIPVP